MTVVSWVASFAASGAIAFGAYRARSLNQSGFAAAFLIGGLITAAGGWRLGAILIAFFISSSLLSKIADRLRPGHDTLVARGSRRDALQVLANGGVATICALAYSAGHDTVALVAYAASLATAAADTWATEIGAFSRRPPRLITTLRAVPRGVSGAVSPLGTAATVAGAIVMAGVALLLLRDEVNQGVSFLAAVALGGIAGSLFDSLLGATLQYQAFCPSCQVMTEARIHLCGTPTQRTRGLPFLTNDVVNISAIVAGTLIGALIWSR